MEMAECFYVWRDEGGGEGSCDACREWRQSVRVVFAQEGETFERSC